MVMAQDLDRYRAAEAAVWRSVDAMPVERWVRLRSGEAVRVQEVGSGPPAVFIHGASIAGTSWAHLVAALEGVRCIVLDRPGCGLSDPIAGSPLRDLAAIERYADRLLPDLLDALQLDEAAVVATSFGGYFAFRGAASSPDRVSKLLELSWLVGAPIESAPTAVRIASIPGLRAVMSRVPMSRSMVRAALRQFGLGKAIDSGAFDDTSLDWAHSLLRDTDTLVNDVGSSPRLVTPIAGENPDVLFDDELLARLTMPVLFLWGADDPNGGVAIARSFAPRLPNAELVVIPDAQHAPWLDALDLCANRAQAFLTG